MYKIVSTGILVVHNSQERNPENYRERQIREQRDYSSMRIMWLRS